MKKIILYCLLGVSSSVLQSCNHEKDQPVKKKANQLPSRFVIQYPVGFNDPPVFSDVYELKEEKEDFWVVRSIKNPKEVIYISKGSDYYFEPF